MKRTFTIFQAWFLLSFPALITTTLSAADLLVTPTIVDFSNSTPSRQRIEITASTSNIPHYIEVSASRILNPGTENAYLIAVDNTDLIVTPPRFVLPVNDCKTIEITSMRTPTSNDDIFQLEIISSPMPQTADISDVVKNSHTVLIILRPQEASSQLSATRENDQLFITNKGNTNAVLYNGKSCSSESQCTSVEHKRLFAGQIWKMFLQGDHQVSFDVYNGYQTYRQTFK